MKELVIKKGRPLLNYVILTADRYTAEELAEMNGGIINPTAIGQLKPYQKIISVSPRLTNSCLEVDQTVLINIQRYGKSVQRKNSYVESTDEHYDAHVRYEVPVIDIDGKECLKLGDNDIEFIIDEFEMKEVKKESVIIDTAPKDIIKPGPGLIL